MIFPSCAFFCSCPFVSDLKWFHFSFTICWCFIIRYSSLFHSHDSFEITIFNWLWMIVRRVIFYHLRANTLTQFVSIICSFFAVFSSFDSILIFIDSLLAAMHVHKLVYMSHLIFVTIFFYSFVFVFLLSNLGIIHKYIIRLKYLHLNGYRI